MSPRSPRWILPAILALAVALRLLAWRGAVLMTNDGPDFLWQAGRLLAGDVRGALSHPYHPLYAAATAALAPLAGGTLHAALAVSILSALGVVLAVRAMAARAFPASRAAPDAAALLAALHGRLLLSTADIQSDGLFLALAALACATLLAAAERGGCRRRLLLAGLLTGLAYLTRPEGLFLVGIAGLWWLLAAARATSAPPAAGASPVAGASPAAGASPVARVSPVAGASRSEDGPRAVVPVGRSTSGFALFVAGTALCVLPYVLALHELTGRWGLSLKPSIAAAGLGDPGADFPLPPDCPLASPHVYRARPAATGTRAGAAGNSPVTAPAPAPTTAPADPHATASAATTPATTPATPGATPGAMPGATPGAQSAATPAAMPGAESAATSGAASGDSVETRGSGEDDEDGDDGLAGGASSRQLLPSMLRAAGVLCHALRIDTAALALVGWLALRRRRPGLAALVVALVLAWWTVGGVHLWLSGALNARHTLLATVLLLPLAGAGLAALWTRAGAWIAGIAATTKAPAAARAGGLALRAALVLVLAAQAGAGVRPRHAGSEARLEALAWAAAHTAPGERLAVHRRKDGFYAGRPVLEVHFPCTDVEFFNKLDVYGVALAVLDEERVLRAAPHWLTDGRLAERARFGHGDDTVLVLEPVRG
ncbi:MAG TPA: hypothetical protein VK824_10495 [Planctomycetota bacterium]|nr:hypothetical protein [Planctomycetota bacterium]